MKAVYFFCGRSAVDPVAHRVFAALSELLPLTPAGIEVDGAPVVKLERGDHGFFFCRTDKVLSHDYPRYLPLLERHFAGFDFAGLVNWHQGGNAPDALFCVHTTGDVATGEWGPANPALTRNLLLAVERHRLAQGLAEFRTVAEATHWSGVPHGGEPAMIPRFKVPLVDLEIGSSEASWSHPGAAAVLAHAILEVFAPPPPRLRSLLCLGGVHLEPSYTAAVLRGGNGYPFAVSHLLANQWLATSAYEGAAGLAKLAACVDSIAGGIHAIAFHDNLKGAYKDQARATAARLGVPCFKHQKLERPQLLELW